MNTKLKLFLVTVLTALAGAQAAEACVPSRDPHPGITPRCPSVKMMVAKITKADRVLPQHELLHSFVGSDLTIDLTNKLITLPIYCPPNAMCVQMAAVEFKLEKIERLSSGIVRYSGSQTYGHVGVGTSIVITDYSRSNVDQKVPAFTVIEYSTKVVVPGAKAQTSVLFADRLENVVHTL